MDRLRWLSNKLFGYQPINHSSPDAPETLETRSFYFNSPSSTSSHVFAGNKICTGKYNLFTFLPLFLFEQFRKAFNMYFLVICILQQIPDLSPIGQFTTVLPLSLVLLIAAIKEIIEDYKRHRQDDAVNNRMVEVFRDGQFVPVRWIQVVVGDIVRVMNGKFFPADLVFLSSSEHQGMCYVETSYLDGETNLKIRQALPITSHICSSEDLMTFWGRIECEGPNRHLYQFNGNIALKGINNRRVSLSNDQMLLRGAMLRNTQWVFGVVVYTGHETKLMKNANSSPLKMSKVDRVTNKQVLWIAAIIVFLSLASAIVSETGGMEDGKWYIPPDDSKPDVERFFLKFMTFFMLYDFVPISLLVTLEMVKVIQAMFINYDLDMYHEKTDTPAMARTSNLNEELGQVKYIFSDKTGTLTQNQMVFKKCSVAGINYGDDRTAGFNDEQFVKNLVHENGNFKSLRDFATMMSLCHTVVPESTMTDTDDSTSNLNNSSINDVTFNFNDIEYQSSSPDETALVKAARDFGFVFCGRTPTHVTINVLGEEEKYEILNVLEFTSLRKRMSVIVRTPGGAIKLLCKGADSVIYERLAGNSLFQLETANHLREFASEGLRTLCFAYVYLDADLYEDWCTTHYYPASTAVHGREAALVEAYELIEKDLHLLGVSAIEDRLQDGVPETISLLSKAGINTWVLTGDKQETAINIAYSCHIFTSTMSLVILDQTSIDETRTKIMETLSHINSDTLRPGEEIGLVVNGSALKQAITFDLRSSFLDLVFACKALVCCRVSPMQKAEIVHLIKTHCNAITLAIGDGANDVSMIHAAHVGIGISGCEGLQAANSSDYSIAQFAYLQKLLLVHGSWNYTRVTKCVLYIFYRTICLYLIEVWFAFYNGFSCQILFDKWTITMYSVIFTFLPPLTLGLFERTSSRHNMLKYPQLYKLSQGAVTYNTAVFWKTIFNATIHSLLLFFLPLYALRHEIAFENGKTGGYLFLGNCVYMYCVVTVCLKAGLDSSTWTVFTHIALWGSIALCFVVFTGYSYIFPLLPFGEDMVGMANHVLSSLIFWLGLLLIPMTILFMDLLWKVLRRKFMKSLIEKVHESEILGIDSSTRSILQRRSLRQRLVA